MAEEKNLEELRELLRKPFAAEEIEKLPKYTGRKVNGKIPPEAYGYCNECGKRHPLPAIHLDYVGHAGITDRLNDVDPEWNWEPLALDQCGLPLYDSNGGLWIKLTVLGVTRYGYGDAQGKVGPNAVKEIIGDAIRNAAMRFGVATYLWSKSDKAEHIKEAAAELDEDVDLTWIGEQSKRLAAMGYSEAETAGWLADQWRQGGRQQAESAAADMADMARRAEDAQAQQAIAQAAEA